MNKFMRIVIGSLITIIYMSSVTFALPDISSYVYDVDFNPVAAPQPFELELVISGENLGIGSFSQPSDIFVDSNGYVYIVDTNNNRIVELQSNLQLKRVIDSFMNNGSKDYFASPTGIYVTEEGYLYIADNGNNRIVRLNNNLISDLEINRPDSSLLEEKYIFLPMKIVCDNAGRIFIVSDNQPQGVMEFTPDGQFKGFIGANKVTFDFLDYIWKRISTKEQRDQMSLFLPTEYNNITLDSEGFLFVTTDKIDYSSILTRQGYGALDIAERIAPVRRINLAGADILRRDGHGPPVGDYAYTTTKGIINGPSRIIDIAEDVAGIYTILDSARGRLFTYDYSGNLLHIYGGVGNEDGKFRSPTSITYKGNKILVSDYLKNTVTVLRPTEYGMLLREANISYQDGDYEKNELIWRQILDYNANIDVAYVGIAKSYMRELDYRTAMHYFKLGEDRRLYSTAFVKWRNQLVRQYFAIGFWLVFALIVFVLLVIYIKHYRKWLKEKTKVMEGEN